jgi:hypothetical protein
MRFSSFQRNDHCLFILDWRTLSLHNWQMENSFFSSTVPCDFQLPFLLYHQVPPSVWISLRHVNIERLLVSFFPVHIGHTKVE